MNKITLLKLRISHTFQSGLETSCLAIILLLCWSVFIKEKGIHHGLVLLTGA